MSHLICLISKQRVSFGTFYSLFWLSYLIGSLLLSGCYRFKGGGIGGGYDLATVSIKELQDLEYDSIRLRVLTSLNSDQPVLEVKGRRGQGTLEGSVPPGSYAIRLEYFLNGTLQFSSLGCSNPPMFSLKAGINPLIIYLCDDDGRRVSRDEISCLPGQRSLGQRQLRLLTNFEYQNTVMALTGFSDDFTSDFPKEVKFHGIENLADKRIVTDSHADAYLRAAEKIAQRVRRERDRFINCGQTNPDLCIEKFIRDFGQRVFRGPVTEDELRGLRDVFSSGRRDGGSFDDGFELTVQAMLFAPRFLYRSELGQPDREEFLLSPWEIAQGLSYLYWGTMPDERLFSLAQTGELSSPSVIRSESERLLQDPRSREVTGKLVLCWLGSDAVLAVNKDTQRFPEFDSNLRASLRNETKDFFNDVVFRKNGRFSDLFQSAESVGGRELARLYDARLDGGRIQFDGNERRGLLGHGSVLATYADADQTSPIRRGVFVLDKILCQEMPPPPASLMVMPPPRNSNLSTRERFAAHSSNAACSGCHKRIDGIGFGMEDMDEIGRFRTQDSGRSVDDRGIVLGLDGEDKSFQGTSELSAHIANSKMAEQCFAKQMYRRTSGSLETQADVCTIDGLTRQLSGPNGNIMGFLLAIPQQEAFLRKHK